MKINIYSFLLPSIAGLSTLLGTILIFFKFKNHNKVIINTLAFASGVMITISLIELIPESYKILSSYFKTFPSIIIITIFFCIGSIITLFINKNIEGKSSNKLYNIGIISVVVIILHNIPEGMVTFIATSNDLKIGITLMLAIMLHNIPEGISISIPIYYSSKKRSRAIIYTLISALSEPFGALLTFLFLKKYINNTILSILFAIISGIMINISFYELLPESLSYKKPKNTLFFLFIGIISTILINILF